MNRKVLLIGYKGTDEQPLVGLDKDFEHYRDFFQKPFAGLYSPNEILEYTNLSVSDLEEIVKDLKVQNEALVIVLIVHGGTDFHDNIYYHISDGNDVYLYEIESWTSGIPCLLIADSCRGRWPEPITESVRTRTFSSVGSMPKPDEYRALYDDCIRNLDTDYFAAGFACSDGESAYETSNGGKYSCAILGAAIRISEELIQQNKRIYAGYSYVHMQASQAFIHNTKQHPDYYGPRTRSQFPFVVNP